GLQVKSSRHRGKVQIDNRDDGIEHEQVEHVIFWPLVKIVDERDQQHQRLNKKSNHARARTQRQEPHRRHERQQAQKWQCYVEVLLLQDSAELCGIFHIVKP